MLSGPLTDKGVVGAPVFASISEEFGGAGAAGVLAGILVVSVITGGANADSGAKARGGSKTSIMDVSTLPRSQILHTVFRPCRRMTGGNGS